MLYTNNHHSSSHGKCYYTKAIYTHTQHFLLLLLYTQTTVLWLRLYFNFLSTFPDISCSIYVVAFLFFHLYKHNITSYATTGRHGYLLLPMPEINTQPKIILEGHFNSRYAKEWKFVLNNASKLNQSVFFVSLQLQ